MLTEYNYVGRLLKFLQKLFQGKNLKEKTEFVNLYQIHEDSSLYESTQ